MFLDLTQLTLAKLKSVQAKKYSVTLNNRSPEYSELSEALRSEGYQFDINPAKISGQVVFVIKTNWKKKN